MAEFSVDVEKILASSEQIKNTAIKMNEYGIALDDIRKGGIFYASNGSIVDESVRRQFEKILNEAARMDSFGNALQLIAEKYSDTEKLLIGSITGETVSDSDQSASSASSEGERGTDKRKWYQKFWDWITRQEPDDYDTTTIEQEKAADESMRRQLCDVLQDEKYSREYWENASIEERKQILQDYMNEVIRIYGLRDVKPNIKWDSLKYEPTSCTMGQYTHGNHTVTLNENVLSDKYQWKSYDYLLQTVSHELRHAYQHEAVDHPTRFMVSQETIDSWRDNFEPGHYVTPSTDYQRYRDQPVEVDARSFQVQRDGTVSD